MFSLINFQSEANIEKKCYVWKVKLMNFVALVLNNAFRNFKKIGTKFMKWKKNMIAYNIMYKLSLKIH